MSSHREAPAGTRSRVDIALLISALAAVVYVIAMVVAQEDNEWLWPLAGVLGAIGAVLGFQAGRPRPGGKALLAVVLGGLVFLVILGWVVWALSTGNF